MQYQRVKHAILGKYFKANRHIEFKTYRLTSPPSMVKLLSPSKMESSIEYRIIH